MRIAVYTDYVYRRVDGDVYAERTFALFLDRVAAELGELTILGRLAPGDGPAHYRLSPEVRLEPLPYYPSLAHVVPALRSMLASLRVFWRVAGDADAVWLLGPHPLALLFAFLTAARRRRVILGVRQDTSGYIRARYPGRPGYRAVWRLLDMAFRVLARVFPVVVVGPEIARQYRHAPSVLEIAVSLVDEQDIVTVETASARSYDGELRLLTVGRLEPEKDPLLLADVLAGLRAEDARWRLVVCGEGPREADLRSRLAALGVADFCDLRGYVPLRPVLMDLYRHSHAFLHMSLTEGAPQVLYEAFAARLPVVATAVGGVAQVAGDAALLVEPRNAAACVAALRRVATEPVLRDRLTRAGAERVAAHTFAAEARRVAEFLAVSARTSARGS